MASSGSRVVTEMRHHQPLVPLHPVLDRPVIEGATERRREIRVGQDGGAVGARPRQEHFIDIPEIEVLLAQPFVGRAHLAAVVFRQVATRVHVGACRVVGDIEIAGTGEANALLDGLLAVDAGEIGQQVFGLIDRLMHVAIDQAPGPCARRRTSPAP